MPDDAPAPAVPPVPPPPPSPSPSQPSSWSQPSSVPAPSSSVAAASPYPTRRALREARERAAREAQAAGETSAVGGAQAAGETSARHRPEPPVAPAGHPLPVLHLPTAPAGPRGPAAPDESHVPGPPVLASATTGRHTVVAASGGVVGATDGPTAPSARPAPAPAAVPAAPAVPSLAGRLARARAAGASVGPRPSLPHGTRLAPAAPVPVAPSVPAAVVAAAPVPVAVASAPVAEVAEPAWPAVAGAAFVRTAAPRPVPHAGRTVPARRPLARSVRWSAQAAVLAAVVGSTGAFAAYHRTLTLDVDGTTESVDAYGWTVGDVLAQQGVHVGPDDVVEPAVSASARGVDEVVVRRSHEVQVEINGDTRTIRTTASTVGELLDALGERGGAVSASASRSEPLGRTPLRLVTSKEVHVLVDGQDLAITTSAATVADVLADAGVTLGPKDATSAPGGAAAVDGMVILVSRGTTSSTSETEVLKFASTTVKDPTLPKGQKVVRTVGRVGQAVRTYSVTTKGGVEVSRKLVSQRVVTKPVDEVVAVGTLVLPDPATVVVSPGSAQAIAKSMVADRGWGASQFSCLVSLWNRESGWRVTASNAGSGAYGIPQALPGSKMASAGADWRTNAATQIAWGLGYVASRYGTPCAAWAHSQSTGWY